MFLFTSGNFLAVPRVTAFTVREKGREEGPQAHTGEENKYEEEDRKRKSRMLKYSQRKRNIF